ncbi:hypothetical protein niasHS_003058 [Heterodera schachtii]|uniref:Nuclear receptor domain-containing protein n=1 Tax=Heterodera schachtii TaxID=97005 RepID=A0ABD2K9K0_HETSC
MDTNKPIKVKRAYKKRQKIPKQCLICERISHFRYYNVQSCDGCKQFFRRAVIRQRTFTCPKTNSCILNNANETTVCRACRLDKCLLVGMDPTLLEIEKTPALHCFIQWLYQRRFFLRQQNTNGLNAHIDTQVTLDYAENYEPSSSSSSSSSATSSSPIIQDVSYETRQPFAWPPREIASKLWDKSLAIRQTIRSMHSVEQQIRAFISIRREFYDGFFEQFSTLNDFLKNAESIVANPDKYTKAVGPHPSPHQIYMHVAKHGNFSGKYNLLLFEIVSVIDLCRTMPHFKCLEPNDQSIIMHFVAIPLIELNERFYSSKVNSPIVTSIRTMRLVRCFFTPIIRVITATKLSKHWPIPSITGLSPAGRRTLQQWSDHYADLLMSHLRINYGNLTAAQRFAELVHLLEAVLFSTKKHHEFLTYLAMVTEQDRFHASFPPIFVPMLLHGKPG